MIFANYHFTIQNGYIAAPESRADLPQAAKLTIKSQPRQRLTKKSPPLTYNYCYSNYYA